MASSSAHVNAAPIDAADSQSAGNDVDSASPSAGFTELAQRCRDLGIAGSFDPSIESAVAAIAKARKPHRWKNVQYEKLRQRVKRAIDEAEAVAARQARPAPKLGKQRVLPPPPPQQRDGDGDGSGGAGGQQPANVVHAVSGKTTPVVGTAAAPPAQQPAPLPPAVVAPPPPSAPPQQHDQQPVDDDTLEAALEAALNALSSREERAFIAWSESTSTDAELDGEFSPQAELDKLATWRAEVAARAANPAMAAALDAMNRMRVTSGERALRLETLQAGNAVLQSLDAVVRDDFVSWLEGRGIIEPQAEPDLDELLSDWRSSPEYERTKAERIAESCMCTPGTERVFMLPWAELKRRAEDGITSLPSESQAAYDARVRADREARGVELGEYFTNPLAFRGVHYPSCTCRYDGEARACSSNRRLIAACTECHESSRVCAARDAGGPWADMRRRRWPIRRRHAGRPHQLRLAAWRMAARRW